MRRERNAAAFSLSLTTLTDDGVDVISLGNRTHLAINTRKNNNSQNGRSLPLDAAYFQIEDIPFTKGNKQKKKGENGFLFFLFIYTTFDYQVEDLSIDII